ncbi:MAG: hypothetical protein Ct9H300mP27_04810 [Chloroflexota bacterium]|nr:MAG: hypothetical protein Ct9H300mP27_04810 [Chloroflexota bacterium]
MVKGGYKVSGRWSFASGIRHSEWVAGGAVVKNQKEDAPQQIRLVVPTVQVQIHDNWQVVGLKGTGSCDYSISDVFVPEGLHGLGLNQNLVGAGLIFCWGVRACKRQGIVVLLWAWEDEH